MIDFAKKLLFIITLVVVTSVIFIFGTSAKDKIFAISVKSESIEKPWNTQIDFLFDGKKISYRLENNLFGLSDIQRQKRLVYRASKSKSTFVMQRQREGIEQMLTLCFLFPNLQKTIDKIRLQIDEKPIDATIAFFPDRQKKFEYTQHAYGRETDLKSLAQELADALTKGLNRFSLQVPILTIKPNLTLLDAQKATVQKAIYETTCFSSGQNRRNNIAKALSFFNGKIIEKDEKVSFNEVVGQRTKERGFFEAKVLLNGQYVKGVGGGVCQASTTLFCALLKADIKILNVCQHSVKSNYVEPSFDAMVNDGSADLVFQNNTQSKLYISAALVGGRVRVSVFGLPNKYEIRLRSITKSVEPYSVQTKADKEQKYNQTVFYEDESFVLVRGVDGLKSQGYLDYFEGNKFVYSRLIRQNSYAAINQVVIKGTHKRVDTTKEITEKENNLDIAN